MKRAGFFVDHPAAHRNRVFQHFIGNSNLLERMDPAGGKREIDRASADHVAFAWIAPAFVKLDLVSASAEIRGEQTAGQSRADENEFGHRPKCLTADDADITDFQIK